MTAPSAGQELDALRQPLTGRCLIEASAGTGKTYAITSLVLRLLLGHDGRSTGVNPLRLEDILIVTFTRAATEELRGRIRERLYEARAAFASGAPESADTLIAALRTESADESADRDRLALAAMSLDLASILTIHGFAARVLQRHAFESGASFAADISENDGHVLRETVLDIWRERVYPLPSLASDAIHAGWKSPGKFIKDVRELLPRQELGWRGVPPHDWESLLAELRVAEQVLRALAATPSAEAERLQLWAQLKVEGQRALEAFFEAAAQDVLKLSHLDNIAREKLAALRLKRVVDKGEDMPEMPLLEDAAALSRHAVLLRQRLLHDAVTDAFRRLASRKARTAELGFDDLLRLLADGLEAPEQGDRLAQLIREQYRAALVDECQDTDPLQWKVFDRIYRDGGTLFLVGDPKQAIYSFRGADVYAYLKARREAAELRSLGVSWRSTDALVKALNALFSLRGDKDTFRAPGLAYADVTAAGKADSKPMQLRGQAVAPLQVLGPLDAGLMDENAYRDRLCTEVADHVAGMLADAAAGALTIDGKRLQAGDIALLVRGWRDAVPLVRALSRRGVPVVSRARDSVYQSNAAASVFALLRAVLEPRSERALRAALASILAGRDAAGLDTLFADESRMLGLQETFMSCRERLRSRGVQAMFRHLFRELGVPARALASADGERLLTDSLHLIELLAAERATQDSDEALLARFAERIANPDGDREEQQLRLESDAERVRILTIHASKGLEFPVVVLPFPVQRYTQQKPLFHDTQTLQPVYDLAHEDASLAQADQERLAEDLRLLYVALTRAKYSCVIGVADVSKYGASMLGETALGWLLEADVLGSTAALQRLGALPGAVVLPTPPAAMLPAAAAATGQLSGRALRVSLDHGWSSTSYSALSSHRPDAERAAQTFRQPELDASERRRNAEPDYSPFGFPRGPGYGDMLHKVLEHVDLAQPANTPANAALIRAALLRIGLPECWESVVAQMIDELRECPLDGRAMRLAAIPRNQRVMEMGFELPVARLDAPAVNALMHAHEPLATQATPLSFKPMHGMLTGFIDLVFCHEGRYYVADFKSNHLGDTLADYGEPQQQKVIAEHRYDLQYTLYTVALMRYLRVRLGDHFDYDTHMGGVYYLFLRGIRSADGNRQGVFFTLPARPLVEGLDAMLGGVAP
jgi:exodeoxyribonuclease V beta subunit